MKDPIDVQMAWKIWNDLKKINAQLWNHYGAEFVDLFEQEKEEELRQMENALARDDCF